MKAPVPQRGNHVHLVSDGGDTRIVMVESEYRFAFALRNSARVMASQARKVEGNAASYELKAFVVGAISLSYSALEAELNEFLFLNALSEDSPLSEAERAVIWTIADEGLRPEGSSHVLDGFNLMLRVLGKEELAEGEEPLQSANLVRVLRNLLVHPKPGRVVTFDERPDVDISAQQKIVRQLRAPLGLGEDATFPTDILTSTCADWCVSSCERFIHEFVARSEVDCGHVTEPIWETKAAQPPLA